MISALFCLTFLAPLDGVDELFKSLEEARKLGLPVTAEERAGPPLTPGMIANQKLMESLSKITRANKLSVDPKSSSAKLVSQKGWKDSIAIIERLAKSPEAMTKLSGSGLSFPATAQMKLMVRMELIDSTAFVERKDFSTATLKLASARRLIDNPVWGQSFIALMSGHAVQEIYISTLSKIKLANRAQFKKLPANLFAPFMAPNFETILRNDFASSFTEMSSKETLTRDNLPNDNRTVEALRVMAKNWVVLYPELKGAISWTNLQTAYLNIDPELETVNVGGDPFSFCPEFLKGTAFLDKKQEERNYKLQALQRQ